jgi:hypothetical protein
MEHWFHAHSQADNEMRPFKPDRIDLVKLIQHQDINEVLILIEFIFCIVLKSDNAEELLQNLADLTESSANDMQQLIEGANIEMSEMPEESFIGDTDIEAGSFVTANVQYKAKVAKQMEEGDLRRRDLEFQLIDMEE